MTRKLNIDKLSFLHDFDEPNTYFNGQEWETEVWLKGTTENEKERLRKLRKTVRQIYENREL